MWFLVTGKVVNVCAAVRVSLGLGPTRAPGSIARGRRCLSSKWLEETQVVGSRGMGWVTQVTQGQSHALNHLPRKSPELW